MGKNIDKKIQRKLEQLPPERLEALLAEMRNPSWSKPSKVHYLALGDSEVRYGVYGDRHHGSIYHDGEALKRFADEANKWKVQFMLDPGDSVDGSFNMHRGMWREQSALGFDEQLEELIKNTPDLNVPLYHINGNHDYSWLKTEGVNLGEHYQKNHKDVKHLGTSSAVLRVGKTNIQLLHPGGGSSYALSYRPQKIVESFEGGSKPQILHINHFHKMGQMFYRNVHLFLDGTFQSQTPFMMEKGLAAHKGGWLIAFSPDKFGNVAEITTKFIPFYR